MPDVLEIAPVPVPKRAWVIVARASITAAADRELQILCKRLYAALQTLPALHGAEPLCEAQIHCAYTEQGEPSLRSVMQKLADEGVGEVCLLPMLMPMEPGTALALQRIIKRWRSQRLEDCGPVVRIAQAPSLHNSTDALLGDMACSAQHAPAEESRRVPDAEGATVPTQRWRVLVCAGGPCTDAGANLIWGHLRNMQKARGLRTEGPGVMTCKTTCLGPCALGPVLQVWPDGTWYGGVDEADVERIVEQHLLAGEPVGELAYTPQPGKQRLRPARPQQTQNQQT